MDMPQRNLLESTGAARNSPPDRPLVSIICFCKDRVKTIRRAVDSVLGQSYANFEFVVQDGASSDGTVEILRSYDDPRIKLVSEPDTGPAEAFWKVVNRCRGDIIATCLSDEELLPHAIERAVELFRQNPELGAVTCNGYITDPKGKVTGEFIAGDFNLVDYLFGPYCPFWPGSFIRRQALVDVGLYDHQWTIGSLEFEIWCRLGTRHNVRYFPEFMSKYAIDAGQLSNTPKSWTEHLDNRVYLVEQMFSDEGFFGPSHVNKIACLYNQHYLFYNHARAYKIYDQMEAIYHRMMVLLKQLNPLEWNEYHLNFALPEEDQILVQGRMHRLWERIARLLPRFVRGVIPRNAKTWARTTAMRLMMVLFRYVVPPRTYFKEKHAAQLANERMRGLTAPSIPRALYAEFAGLYYARGQIRQALEMWRRAEPLKDPMIDALACQAMLLSPEATYDGLLEIQKRWAANHLAKQPPIGAHAWQPWRGDRKVRIGYYCSFMDGDTIRFIMSAVIKRHNRERFEVFGYSIASVAPDIGDAFDTFRVTRGQSDEQFAELMRSDGIDIFIEMSGFSPYHRFGAMALRCAPVQVSYLNHTGTSGVPFVDYILADEASLPPAEDRWFTEKVWRLPGCFLCYNYDMVELPPVAERPSKSNRYMTFGCFGSGGKINDDLIALWAQILHRVSGSRIYLRNHQLTPKDNRNFMRERFRRHGIDPDRVRLEGGASRETIVKSYDELDVSLDTWPYCGGNTVAESLWQGVPVVTLKGDRFSSRYGASLLAAAGCEDLIGETLDQYVAIAVSLAQSPQRLDQYRDGLRAMARQYGLSDTVAFAHKLDAAYVEMMRRRWGESATA